MKTYLTLAFFLLLFSCEVVAANLIHNGDFGMQVDRQFLPVIPNGHTLVFITGL